MLVGGLGTRLRPLTRHVPKQMLPVVNRPMIEWSIAHIAAHGVDGVVLSLGYGADSFFQAYPDGACAGVIVMRRTLRAGDTYKAFVVRDPTIEAHVMAVADALKPFGACNFQLRLKNGEPYIFEINARCSGSASGTFTTRTRRPTWFNARSCAR